MQNLSGTPWFFFFFLIKFSYLNWATNSSLLMTSACPMWKAGNRHGVLQECPSPGPCSSLIPSKHRSVTSGVIKFKWVCVDYDSHPPHSGAPKSHLISQMRWQNSCRLTSAYQLHSEGSQSPSNAWHYGLRGWLQQNGVRNGASLVGQRQWAVRSDWSGSYIGPSTC